MKKYDSLMVESAGIVHSGNSKCQYRIKISD